MPFANRLIQPILVSDVVVPETVDNEFNYIVNATLTNFIKQLSCLSVKVNEIFGELTLSICDITDRSNNLEQRIDGLGKRVGDLDVNKSLPLESPKVNIFKSNTIDDDLIDHTKMPDCIQQMLNDAEPPPALHKFDEFREKGEESLCYYTDPAFFLREWIRNTKPKKVKKSKNPKRTKSKKKIRNRIPPTIPQQKAVPPPPNNEASTVTNYNFADISEYQDPAMFKQSDDPALPLPDAPSPTTLPPPPAINTTIPPPPPTIVAAPPPPPEAIPPPPPPPPPPISSVVPSTPQSQRQQQPQQPSPSTPVVSLLDEIRKGAALKPVSTEQQNTGGKRREKDLRDVIIALRQNWSDEESSEADSNDDDD